MAGEPILVVDDTPVNLKLTRILLVNEGYKVLTAATAEEALDVLQGFHPRLILADVQLPGIDGLEMTRRIKANEQTRDIVVVALTAFAMQADRQRAVDAGCDGYIAKPIDTRELGRRIREILDNHAAPGVGEAANGAHAPKMANGELAVLRRQFLEEGHERVRQLLLDVDGGLDARAAARTLHQWKGTGGMLGYGAISRIAREAEQIVREQPTDSGQLREALTRLALAFDTPPEAHEAGLPERIVRSLTGKPIAAVGLPAGEMERLNVALERVGAHPRVFDLASAPDTEALGDCELAVIFVCPDGNGGAWLSRVAEGGLVPAVLVGERDHLLALSPAVQAAARGFLMDSWQPDEALVRMTLAIPRQQGAMAATRHHSPAPEGHIRVVAADDDPTALSLVGLALENFGMDCERACDGPSALEAVRRTRPHAVVLDINMPGMNGYEVLTAIRAERLPVRVLLLTARQQERDIIRGFSLGADDYVVKPFSPLELVARLKRLLAK